MAVQFKELLEKYLKLVISMRPKGCNLIVCVLESIKNFERIDGLKCQYKVNDGVDIPNWKNFISDSDNKRESFRKVISE